MLAPAQPKKTKLPAIMIKSDFLDAVDAVRRVAAENLNEANSYTRGQVFTPAHIAQLMASMIEPATENISLLDAGAGTGILTAACVAHLCKKQNKPHGIFVTAVEIDSGLLPSLRQTLELCRSECEKCEIDFSYEIANQDLIAVASTAQKRKFNLAILNPPYKKINARSESNRMLSRMGINVPNFYAAFLALCTELLEDNGELVAITPRSFCNGTYFKAFRKYFLDRMTFTQFHVFESRKEVFDSNVLQENVVFRAVKSQAKIQTVIVSVSYDGKGGGDETRSLASNQLICPADGELFIHLDGDDTKESQSSLIRYFQTSLEELGLKVSTGRVVDFRAKEYLQNGLEIDGARAAPLIYPHNMKSGRVVYPVERAKKYDAIRIIPETQSQLVESGTYVLVKRFSAKEEKRRITAALFEKPNAPGDKIGFENHLNYFHASGSEIEPALAKGLVIYLNSSLLDEYFRRFSGHTQVNATDLRYLKYPTRAELEALGNNYNDELPAPDKIDELISQLITDERN